MADRVHPRDSPPSSSEFKLSPSSSPGRPQVPSPEKPVPPPGTYVVQVPKDQVYRVPPPENAIRFEQLSNRKPRRSPCCCFLCWLLGIFVTIILLAGVTALILFLVFRPKFPNYSIESVAINGFNLTSSAPISPDFDVTVRANNPNDKIGIDYRKGSAINVYYNDIRICNGELPVFYQGNNNVTVFVTALKGSGLALTSAARTALGDEQSKGTVPFTVKLRVPVKIKVGSVKTWTITVKVDCDVTVNSLTANAKIVSKKCDRGVNIW